MTEVFKGSLKENNFCKTQIFNKYDMYKTIFLNIVVFIEELIKSWY
jgi:hypothetical protein